MSRVIVDYSLLAAPAFAHGKEEAGSSHCLRPPLTMPMIVSTSTRSRARRMRGAGAGPVSCEPCKSSESIS
jgi:hypothetical protein